MSVLPGNDLICFEMIHSNFDIIETSKKLFHTTEHPHQSTS